MAGQPIDDMFLQAQRTVTTKGLEDVDEKTLLVAMTGVLHNDHKDMGAKMDAVGDEAPETVPNTNARRTGFALVNIEEPA